MYVFSSIIVANDLTYLCLEYKVYFKKKSQHDSSPLSRGTIQVVLIKQPASREPRFGNNQPQPENNRPFYTLHWDTQDPVSRCAAGLWGPASTTPGIGH